jgi:hypothetical protein
MSIPTRRDAAGVDKAADISQALRKVDLVNGRQITVTADGVGALKVKHGLGRRYTGALLSGIAWGNTGALIYPLAPDSVTAQGGDPRTTIWFYNPGLPGPTTFEFWVY